MASAQQPVKRGGKAHFQFIDVAAFPRLEGEEPGRALIPQDIGQQPWPDYPTMWDVDRAYLTEHAIPQRCDVKRSATCLFSSYRSLDPMTDARTYNRAQARDYIAMRRADGVCDGTIRRELSIRQAALRHAVREDTFCSWRMQAGFSAEIIGALIGDDPTMVRMVYGHLAPDHLRAVSEMDLSILRVERRVAA